MGSRVLHRPSELAAVTGHVEYWNLTPSLRFSLRLFLGVLVVADAADLDTVRQHQTGHKREFVAVVTQRGVFHLRRGRLIAVLGHFARNILNLIRPMASGG